MFPRIVLFLLYFTANPGRQVTMHLLTSEVIELTAQDILTDVYNNHVLVGQDSANYGRKLNQRRFG